MAKRISKRKMPSPQAAKGHFDYSAVSGKPRRTPPSRKLFAEHLILPESKRRILIATTQDAIRNFTLAGWMLRRHLDYVSRFRFQVNAPEGAESLAKLLERLFNWHSQPRNFDVCGRLGREETFRLFEQEKMLSGDAGLLLCANGKVQRIESDLIARPAIGRPNSAGRYDPLTDEAKNVPENGAILARDGSGRVEKWCICNRGHDGRQIAFDHLESEQNLIFDGYWLRYSSQIRGISPFAAALDGLKDLAEGFEWNLIKAKIHSLFGIAVMRNEIYGATTPEEVARGYGDAVMRTPIALPQPGEAMAPADFADAASSSPAIEAREAAKNRLPDEISPDSPLMLDLGQSDRVDTIESHTPSAEFREYSELMIRLCLLALDIPYSSFDSRASSYAAMIKDSNDYDKACDWKRAKNKWARKAYSDWLVQRAWDDPDWHLSSVAAQTGFRSIREVQEICEWVPDGVAWLQKSQEVQGDARAISAGLDNPIDICRRRGGNVFENIEKTARVYAAARKAGVPISFGDSGQSSVQEQIEIENDQKTESTEK